jgi:Aldehyde ferredoxin oxidoreductase, domains 2 & 3
MYPKAREEYSIEMARENTWTFCHRNARSVADLDMMLQGYYRARGWTAAGLIPEQKLHELDICDIVHASSRLSPSSP